MTPATSAVVLAAGRSSRMGRPKLALPLGTSTVLQAALRPLVASPVDAIVVVVGCDAERLAPALRELRDPRLRTVTNAAWADGIGASLACGVRAVPPEHHVLVALGDEPAVPGALVSAVLASARGGAPLVVPLCGDRPVHPVLFAPELRPELLALVGDTGGRAVVRRHLSRAVRLAAEPTPDLDRPGDYEALLLSWPRP